MAMASPTPLGSSHFASLSRRPSSRQAYRPAPLRPPISRGEPLKTETHARTYSLNDSSDEEVPMPMKFSALTKALLNDEPSIVEPSPSRPALRSPKTAEHASIESETSPLIDFRSQARASPISRVHSPYPRRIVRLSGSPGSSSLRRTSPLSSVVVKQVEESAVRNERSIDLSTPAHVPRTVRIPVTSSGNPSGGSSGKISSSAGSASRGDEEAPSSQEYPATIARSQLATSQGSVSRYGSSTIGRTKHADDVGLQSSMRVKRVGKVAGSFLSGPARRGRRRLEDEDQSPIDEQNDGLDSAGARQEPQSQESQESRAQSRGPGSNQGSDVNRASLFSTTYRDFASGSPLSSREAIDSVLIPKPPPVSTLANHKALHTTASALRAIIQPIFTVPAPRPDLPSAHDQENEAPPTFKRNKQGPIIHLDKLEKISVRPAGLDLKSIELSAIHGNSPSRQPLAPRSQNTPRRPAPPPPKMSILDAATSTAGAATAAKEGARRNKLKLNGKQYTKLDCIGRGGSSRVYRVMAENSKFFALKRVSLEDADEAAVRGFKGEIDLLKKLERVDRVIRLYDYELNEEKGTLSVLMEMGELDLNKILELRLKSDHAKFDVSFVRHYWKEMLECLQAIHEHHIVHSDLKPHNFVLVQGRLKLIDFGIANAIQTDETVNVHRETQIGTPNYMSPESLMDSNGKTDSKGRISNEPKLMKLGKPSDIWSLGCILYQMTYGRAPFAHIPNQLQRCQAIINFSYAIEYPTVGVGSVPVPANLITTLKKCLNRDQHRRPSATDLLSDRDPFLNPVDYEDALPITEELLGRILLNVAAKCKEQTPTEAELLSLWPKGYFDRLRKNMADGKAL